MKFNMPMAVFGDLALIAAAIAVPQIINVQVIPEANAEMGVEIELSSIAQGVHFIADAIYGIEACHN